MTDRIVKVLTAGLSGIDAVVGELTVMLTPGLSTFTLIGYRDTAAHETRYRVQAALRASGVELPRGRIVVELAPSYVTGAGRVSPIDTIATDLALTTALAELAGAIPAGSTSASLIVGELGLTGKIQPIRGAFVFAEAARERGLRLVCPQANVNEAWLAKPTGEQDGSILAPSSFGRLIQHLTDTGPRVWPEPPSGYLVERVPEAVDFADVFRHPKLERALTAALIGRHSLLIVGPSGAGKTMIARRLPGALPEMTEEEAREVTRIYSAAGLMAGDRARLIDTRPFRAPHHTISEAGLLGGGTPVRPGEITLAHNGVLFLDEVPEFPKRVLGALQQPIRAGAVEIARARRTARLPARPAMLVGAMNPCPCGWRGVDGRCACTDDEVARYLGRIPADLFEMKIVLPPVSAEEAASGPRFSRTSAIQERVKAARTLSMPERCLGGDFAPVSPRDRIAESLARLDGAEVVTDDHITEATALWSGAR